MQLTDEFCPEARKRCNSYVHGVAHDVTHVDHDVQAGQIHSEQNQRLPLLDLLAGDDGRCELTGSLRQLFVSFHWFPDQTGHRSDPGFAGWPQQSGYTSLLFI